MIQPTHHIVSGQNLLDNYKIHYNFNNYSEVSGVDFINSDADSFFPGKVTAINQGLDSTDPFDYFTGNGLITGQGIFSGGLNEFYQYITIQEHTGLNTGADKDFTFIIGAEPTSRQDIGESQKGPVTNNNILFSNMSGSENLYYGWQIGINASNRGYIETYEDLKPKTLTYQDSKTPYGHNIWAFMHRGQELSVGIYDIAQEKFLFQSCPIKPISFSSGSFWNIGSGIKYESRTFTDQMPLNSGLFAGRMSDFIFFDVGLSNDQASLVAKSLYSELYNQKAAVTETVISGFTGFSTGFVAVELESSVYASLSTQQESSSFNFTKKEPLTGSINSGDIEYQLVKTINHDISGTEGIYKSVYHTGSSITGVTGFQNVSYSSGISRSYSVSSDNGQLGDILTGTSYTYLTGSEYLANISGAISGISGNAPELYRPNELSFVNADDDDQFFCEICRSDTFEIANRNSLNRDVEFKNASINDGRAIHLTDDTSADKLSLYVDGRSYELGVLQPNVNFQRDIITDPTTNQTYILTSTGIINIDRFDEDSEDYRTYYRKFNITGGDFALSGREVLEHHIWTGTRGINLNAIYDINQPTGSLSGDSRWIVTGTQSFIDYPNSIFNSGDEDKFVFLNGQKLVSGIDYSNQFSDWSDYVSGESTGVIFLKPNVSDYSLTGNSGNIQNQYYFPNANIVYFNGIRQNYNKYFIENSHTKDLISGVKTVAKNTTRLYNS